MYIPSYSVSQGYYNTTDPRTGEVGVGYRLNANGYPVQDNKANAFGAAADWAKRQIAEREQAAKRDEMYRKLYPQDSFLR
jgi:hypothetical protein